MQLPIYRSARRELKMSEEPLVIGLYVGWRGRSLPWIFDYLTFWDRKAAAIRVGHGDTTELFARLDRLCRDDDTGRRNSNTLVTVGHSFGGQLVYAALSDPLKAQIAARMSGNGGAADDPAPHLQGFGDLVVLVNPALEASAYNSIDSLTRRRRYADDQGPILMVVSSESDWPNRALFPLGRRLSVLAEPHGPPSQYAQKTRALGWYKPQVTHCLAPLDGPPCRGFAEVRVTPRQPCVAEAVPPGGVMVRDSESGGIDLRAANQNAGVWCIEDLENPRTIRLAGELGFAGVRLYRVDQDIDPNNPFLIAKASGRIVSGHNDVFNKTLGGFLIRYAAGVELKRLGVALRTRQVGGKKPTER